MTNQSRINKTEYRLSRTGLNGFYYYKNNKMHRERDLPAVTEWSKTMIWFVEGKKHRDNGKPAKIYTNGKMEWWVAGVLIKRNF